MPTLSMCFEIKIYRTSKHDELLIIQFLKKQFKNLISKTYILMKPYMCQDQSESLGCQYT